MGEPGEQRGERHLGLEAGEVGAEAVVDAAAELHVLAGVGAVDAQRVGVGAPALGVVVGGADAQVEDVAVGDRAVADRPSPSVATRRTNWLGPS